MIIASSRNEISLNEVTSVWYRRPEETIISDEIVDAELREFARNEAKAMLNGLWYAMPDKFWMNQPRHNLISGNKIYQLSIAKAFGFKIPDSLITNDLKVVMDFMSHHDSVIVKPLSGGFIKREGKQSLIYTNRVTVKELKQIDLVKYAPTFFQEYIRKDFELRITVVEKQVFACRIDSQKSERTKDDWRRYDFNCVTHSPFALPKNIEHLCIDFVQGLNLSFGAIDMIVTPVGEYIFLEINPNGQWGWIEKITSLPISDAIIRSLSRN